MKSLKAKKYLEELAVLRTYGVKIPAADVFDRVLAICEGSKVAGFTDGRTQTHISDLQKSFCKDRGVSDDERKRGTDHYN